MANEIKYVHRMECHNGEFDKVIDWGTIQVTQTGVGAYGGVVIVGTSEEDLSTGDVGTYGFVNLKNLDSTNYVQWGPKSGGAMVAVGRLKPTETAMLRLEPGITIRWVANTSAVKVAVELLQS